MHWKVQFARAVDQINGTSFADAHREKVMRERQRLIRDANTILTYPAKYSPAQVKWAKRFLSWKKRG